MRRRSGTDEGFGMGDHFGILGQHRRRRPRKELRVPSYMSQITLTDGLALLLGLALLVAGRRLYWLVLGGLGFYFGLSLAGHLLRGSSSGMELGIAFLSGVVGAWLAVWAQRAAIGVGGFLLGGAAGFWLATTVLAPTLQWRLEIGIWIVAAAGAIVGVVFGAMLFDATLIFLSSVLGALLMASRTHLGHPRELWLVLILLCLGILIQSRSGQQEDED